MLNVWQFGFQSKKSCADALLPFSEFMREALDKKQQGKTVFIDLMKAFDTRERIYRKKLERIGFGNVSSTV